MMKITVLTRISFLFILTLSFFAQAVNLNDDANNIAPLPLEKAFKATISIKNKNTIIAEWLIEKGYYLYRDKFKFVTKTNNTTLGQVDLPKGKKQKDPLFGEVEVFRNKVTIEIPFKVGSKTISELEVDVTSQGCADMGLCYPPHTKKAKLTLVSTNKNNAKTVTAVDTSTTETNPKVTTSAQNTLKEASVFASNLGLEDDQNFLDADKAFAFRLDQLDINTLKVSWKIAPAYYLYQNKFTFKLINAPPGVKLGKAIIPLGKKKKDPQFGTVEVFYKKVAITVPIEGLKKGQSASIQIGYQGCADAGLCYPPDTKSVSIGPPIIQSKTDTTNTTLPSAKKVPAVTTQKTLSSTQQAPLLNATSKTSNPFSNNKNIAEEETFTDNIITRLNSAFINHDLIIIAILTIIVGLIAAFTACLYPLFPIVASIITNQSGPLSAKKGFFLTFIYVQSMAITLGIVGAIMGGVGSGLGIQQALQQPPAQIVFIFFFIVLALSMFGVITLQMPSKLQSKINALSNKQSGTSITGIAIMGALSALIAGPCSTAFLATILGGILSSESILVGFIAMFAMGNGMGLPLLVIGAGGGELLKKPGPWMQTVKSSGGVLLLAVALVFLGRIGWVPVQLTMLLWALWFVSAGVFMRALEPLAEGKGGWRLFWKGIGFFMILYGIVVALGGLTGGKNWTDPLHGSKLLSGSTAPTTLLKVNQRPELATYNLSTKLQKQLHGKKTIKKGLLTFIRIKSVADFERELKSANNAGMTVMLDFYADWCTYCKQFDDYVFSVPSVFSALNNTVLLQADITRNDQIDKALLKRVKVILPPAILFFRTDGKEVRRRRVNGYMNTDKFLRRLRQAFH